MNVLQNEVTLNLIEFNMLREIFLKRKIKQGTLLETNRGLFLVLGLSWENGILGFVVDNICSSNTHDAYQFICLENILTKSKKREDIDLDVFTKNRIPCKYLDYYDKIKGIVDSNIEIKKGSIVANSGEKANNIYELVLDEKRCIRLWLNNLDIELIERIIKEKILTLGSYSIYDFELNSSLNKRVIKVLTDKELERINTYVNRMVIKEKLLHNTYGG